MALTRNASHPRSLAHAAFRSRVGCRRNIEELLDDIRSALLDNSVLLKSLMAAKAQAESTGQNVQIDFMQSSRYMHGVRVAFGFFVRFNRSAPRASHTSVGRRWTLMLSGPPFCKAIHSLGQRPTRAWRNCGAMLSHSPRRRG